MVWRYEPVRESDGTVSLREVYFDLPREAEQNLGWTGAVVVQGYSSVDELVSDLELMLEDARSSPLFVLPPEEPPEVEPLADQIDLGPLEIPPRSPHTH